MGEEEEEPPVFTAQLSLFPPQKEQYVFIHDAILEACLCGETSIPASEFKPTYKEMVRIEPQSNSSQLREEFQVSGLETPPLPLPNSQLSQEGIWGPVLAGMELRGACLPADPELGHSPPGRGGVQHRPPAPQPGEEPQHGRPAARPMPSLPHLRGRRQQQLHQRGLNRCTCAPGGEGRGCFGFRVPTPRCKPPWMVCGLGGGMRRALVPLWVEMLGFLGVIGIISKVSLLDMGALGLQRGCGEAWCGFAARC